MKKTIKVVDFIQDENCVDPCLGDMIFRYIEPEIVKGNEIVLDFEGTKIMTTHFLDSAIGRFFDNDSYKKEKIMGNLTFINAGAHEDLINKVIDNAILYYKLKEIQYGAIYSDMQQV